MINEINWIEALSLIAAAISIVLSLFLLNAVNFLDKENRMLYDRCLARIKELTKELDLLRAKTRGLQQSISQISDDKKEE